MKKKIMCIFMCMLMIFSGMPTILYSYNVNVAASEEESSGRVGLDYDFIYNTVTKYLSEIIFHPEYGKDNEIWKGRCFGTKGERESANAILTWIAQNTNNLDVLQIKKERVGNESDNLPNFSPMKRVNNNMEILSYSVDLREGYSSIPDVIISTNESFIFPIKTTDQELHESTITSNGPIKIRWPPIGYNEEPQNEDDIDFSSYNLNVTKYTMAFTILNESETFIIGETVYLENYSNATSQEKEGKNHLINCSNDDYNDTVEMLHEDNATGFILIRDNISFLKNWSINLPGVAVSQQNGSKLKNLTQNGTVNIFISDYNISQGTGILDVYHCTDDLTLFEKKIWLVNSDWLENRFGGLVIRTYILPAAAFLLCSPVYPQTHFQYPYASNKILAGEDASYSRLKKPIISINGSVVLDGQNKDVWEWVQENYYTDHPVTLNYEFTQMKNPAVESYNVYCDIQGKNTNKWLLMSGGHYDGWYGQMTCDDAVGVAQMIGILKYLNDNEITPKYNTRFIFHSGEETINPSEYFIDIENQKIIEKGTPTNGYADTTPKLIEGIPISDVDLMFMSHVSDEETNRFRLSVYLAGYLRTEHRGGDSYSTANHQFDFMRGQYLRLVNAGPVDKVLTGEIGYPICLTCGATRSPYQSQTEIKKFEEMHNKHCGKKPGRFAITADAQVDGIRFKNFPTIDDGINLAEALRIGANQVLEMDPEDLQILVLPQGTEQYDIFLYDPMIGGSGLLNQLIDRWDEIITSGIEALQSCHNACQKSCYSCMRTYRNRMSHNYLDRHRAIELLTEFKKKPTLDHAIQPIMIEREPIGVSTNLSEARLRKLLRDEGFPPFDAQQEIPIPHKTYKRTVPDLMRVDPVCGAKVAIYLDGLSKGIHGNEVRQKIDNLIRTVLRSEGWHVEEIASSALDDPEMLKYHLRSLSKALKKEK